MKIAQTLSGALFLACCLSFSGATVLTQAQAAEQTFYSQMESNYRQLNKIEDLYERLELAEESLSKLNAYLLANPKQIQTYLLRAKMNLVFAKIQNERGATAIDYWEFVSDVVDPIRSAAYADLQTVFKHATEAPLKAEAHYFMADYYLSNDEPDEALVQQELRLACEGGYQIACKETK